MIVHANCTIHHNIPAEFKPSGKTDPITGEMKMLAVSKTLLAGSIGELPDEVAAEMLTAGACRILTPNEAALYEMSQGATFNV